MARGLPSLSDTSIFEGGKSWVIFIVERIGSMVLFDHFTQALWTSSEKKWSSRGQREKVGTRRRRCRLERREVTECRGRFGWPDRFFFVACWIRDSGGMCVVMCGFCQAHLGLLDIDFEGLNKT